MNIDGQRYIERPRYAALLASYRDTEPIKVLTGVRRCGKSALLLMLAQHLLHSGVPEDNLFYLRLDSYDVPLDADAAWLDRQLQDAVSRARPNAQLYVMLDEVQEIDGWERPLRRLHTQPNVDIYLTGSNAFLLSSDLATYLSGRYVELPIYPLSFEEYRTFARSRTSDDGETGDETLFAHYLRYGGMPGLFRLGNFSQATVERELASIHDTVILNDVAKRFNLKDIDLLEKLVRYVFSTSGNLFSTKKIVDTLTSAGRKVYSETVDSYLNALERAFLVYPCPQTGLQGKTILRPLRKFYAPDTGLRNRETGFAARDTGFQLESVVYMELLRRGYQPEVGVGPWGEIDFVASRASERLYIQVCETLRGEAVREREMHGLIALDSAYPRLVLTLDRENLGIGEQGIRVAHVVDWLLDTE